MGSGVRKLVAWGLAWALGPAAWAGAGPCKVQVDPEAAQQMQWAQEEELLLNLSFGSMKTHTLRQRDLRRVEIVQPGPDEAGTVHITQAERTRTDTLRSPEERREEWLVPGTYAWLPGEEGEARFARMSGAVIDRSVERNLRQVLPPLPHTQHERVEMTPGWVQGWLDPSDYFEGLPEGSTVDASPGTCVRWGKIPAARSELHLTVALPARPLGALEVELYGYVMVHRRTGAVLAIQLGGTLMNESEVDLPGWRGRPVQVRGRARFRAEGSY